jgi:carbonic anhydrase
MYYKILLRTVFFSLLFTNVSIAQAVEVNWGYFQYGEEKVVLPELWGEYFPECNGFKQSPVNIQNIKKSVHSEFVFEYEDTPLSVLNNGHTIEVEYEAGSSMTINGDQYRLLQFHFHSPSEHLVDGMAYPMEMHLVHVNSSGALAVIGVLIESGDENKAFEKVISNAPELPGLNEVEHKYVNVSNLLPDNTHEYFNYSGSLTTPPCSEGVGWFAMKHSIELSENQIKQFEHIIVINARPVQEINERTIYVNND